MNTNGNEMIKLTHAEHGGTFTTTRKAYDRVWAEKGWVHEEQLQEDKAQGRDFSNGRWENPGEDTPAEDRVPKEKPGRRSREQ